MSEKMSCIFARSETFQTTLVNSHTGLLSSWVQFEFESICLAIFFPKEWQEFNTSCECDSTQFKFYKGAIDQLIKFQNKNNMFLWFIYLKEIKNKSTQSNSNLTQTKLLAVELMQDYFSTSCDKYNTFGEILFLEQLFL